MRGYGNSEPSGKPQLSGALRPHELLVCDAVGDVIEFWGFKRNQGRVWALLYVRGTPLSAQELTEQLGLSKGAVSMLTRELESWGVVRRVRAPGGTNWRFQAETDVLQMIGRVVRQREGGLVASVREQLEGALALMREQRDVSPEERARVERMKTLATLVERSVALFVKTARLDVKDALQSLSRDDDIQ